MTNEPLTDSIREIAVIRPGDRLLLTSPTPLTVEQADRVRRAMLDEFPGIEVVILSGLTAMIERADGA
jgi:hypothetical protein